MAVARRRCHPERPARPWGSSDLPLPPPPPSATLARQLITASRWAGLCAPAEFICDEQPCSYLLSAPHKNGHRSVYGVRIQWAGARPCQAVPPYYLITIGMRANQLIHCGLINWSRRRSNWSGLRRVPSSAAAAFRPTIRRAPAAHCHTVNQGPFRAMQHSAGWQKMRAAIQPNHRHAPDRRDWEHCFHSDNDSRE